jgi:hypothetical protein
MCESALNGWISAKWRWPEIASRFTAVPEWVPAQRLKERGEKRICYHRLLCLIQRSWGHRPPRRRVTSTEHQEVWLQIGNLHKETTAAAFLRIKRDCTSPVSRVTAARRRHSGNNMSKHRCVVGKNLGGSQSEPRSAPPSIHTAPAGLSHLLGPDTPSGVPSNRPRKATFNVHNHNAFYHLVLWDLSFFFLFVRKHFDKLLLANFIYPSIW